MSSHCRERRIAHALCALAAMLAFGHVNARELRVCADPDNMPFSDAERHGFELGPRRLLAHERLVFFLL